MNIEQIKADLDNNVIVSRQTWHKLVEAALMMQVTMKECVEWPRYASEKCEETLAKVEAL